MKNQLAVAMDQLKTEQRVSAERRFLLWEALGLLSMKVEDQFPHHDARVEDLCDQIRAVLLR